MVGQSRKHIACAELETNQLIERDLGTSGVVREPPGIPCDCRTTDVQSDDQITEEKPPADQGLPAVTWWNPHDAMIRRIEAECGGRHAVCHQIHPEELDGN